MKLMEIMTNAKPKATKSEIILIISFVPYVLVACYVVYSMIFGITFGFMGSARTSYGLEAIGDSLQWVMLVSMIIPIIPICFFYQVTYLNVYLWKRFKSEPTGYDYKSPQSILTRLAIAIGAIILTVVSVMILISALGMTIVVLKDSLI